VRVSLQILPSVFYILVRV